MLFSKKFDLTNRFALSVLLRVIARDKARSAARDT